jgi:hypothetical protein
MGSGGETLELLLTTHFTNSEVTQELAAPAAALRVGRSDWRLATRVIIDREVEWAIDSFVPYKSPGMDDILQEGGRLLSLTWSGYSVPACLLAIFQSYGDRLWWCLYISSVGIPIADLGTLDLSVSHRFFFRPRIGC